ncbi:MAG: glycosyltransferase [Candidatus Hermodarchaeota archaeon]
MLLKILSAVFYLLGALEALFILLYIPWTLLFLFEYVSLFSITFWLNLLILPIEFFGLLFGSYLAFMVAGAFLQNSRLSLQDFQDRELSTNPKVSILIPVHDVPKKELELTLTETRKLTYSNIEIIIADNSDSKEIREEIKNLAEIYNCQYTYNPNEQGFKAGALNKALKIASGEYILVLDSDHHPVPNLLEVIIRAFQDSEIAFVQVKLLFRDYSRTQYTNASSILNIQFHEVFQRAKDLRKAVIFSGSTACFRKSILNEIGGFREETLTEDIDTCYHLLSQGYHSKAIDMFGSVGTVPPSWKSQVFQLWRWAHGSISVLKNRGKEIIQGPIPKKVKIELILNGMAFFAGISVMGLILLLALMYWYGIEILRPSVEIVIPNFLYSLFPSILQGWISQTQVIPFYLAMPTFIFIGHLSAATIAIVWVNRHTKKRVHSMFQLPGFYVLSLSVHPFLVSAVINAFLGRKAQWTTELHLTRNTIFFSIIGIGLVIVGFKALIAFHPLAILFLVLACAFLAPLMYIFERTQT